ncbi:nitrile hydratase subunit beta [Pseudomonas sp. 008]|uniref:nitrile hydratase subunit beta n=1 Tax=Pseudomonas sp. 008 TaxID=2803906 RepID=UPI00194E1A9A|nr:nitrile hydratase subunit beta [Pseudomonas sp. 008]GID03304.1 nitrile hydratase subunit beta [Pseudomonas sp. 008]
MEGIHDMGGKKGYGAVVMKLNEPVFHQSWEALGYGLGAIGIDLLQVFNWDEVRHAIERIESKHYLTASYYERVLIGVASLFVEKGVVTQAELEQRSGGRFLLSNPVAVNAVEKVPVPRSECFKVGDYVAVRDIHSSGHIRMPAYVRGKRGVVVHIAPSVSFPDASAHSLPRRLEPTYHVRFEVQELWADADENTAIIVDLWQSYLEQA